MTTIRVMATYEAVLRAAVEMTEKRRGEAHFDRQARGLCELGYAIVSCDDVAELDRLRAAQRSKS